MSIRTSFIIGIAVLGTATTAWAQPSVAPVGPPPAAPPAQQPYSQPPPAYPPPAYPATPAPAAQPEQPAAPPKLSFGFRMFQGDLVDEAGNEAPMSGYGVFARYRFSDRWELELDLGKSVAELAPGRTREFRPTAVSALYHLTQFGKIDLHIRAGIGKADETYRRDGAEDSVLKAMEFHAGAGLEYALRRDIGIGAFFRAVSLVRDEESGGLAASGSQLGLMAAYRF